MNETATNARNKAAAYVDWLAMAGIDYSVANEPQNWFKAGNQTEPAAPRQPKPAIENRSAIGAQTPAAAASNYGDTIAEESWPSSLEELIVMLSDGKNLPGNGYGGKTALPTGHAGARLMIVSDIPDVQEVEAGQLGEGANGQLLKNMARAIGYQWEECFLTALATTRPASGDLPDGSTEELKAFILHQAGLVAPERLLILGSAACNALLGAELMTARGNLHYFNYNVQKVAAVTTFHPRTLMARPVLKAQAWKDLQMLMIKDAS